MEITYNEQGQASSVLVFILPIMLYGSECWAVNKADLQRIDALYQWCLRRIVGMILSEMLTFVM